MKLIIPATIIICLIAADSFAGNAGSRGSYTRGGWAGAEYAATGMAGEVLADDVFSIYWNPAGLTELRTRKNLSENQVTEKARQGNVDDITEEDLLNFSESSVDRLFLNLGASYTKLDFDRDAGFAGCAFNFFKGVIGFGLYSITSGDIETRDSSGNLTGHQNYSGSAGMISYAMQWNIVSFGLSLKGYYEKIGDSTYSGAGADAGFQLFLLPFLKLGVMVRDAGGFLKPQDAPDSEDRYDFFKPQIKSGIAFLSDSGFKIALSGSKKLEQTGFEFGGGVEYDVTRFLTVNAGLSDNSFTAGFTMRLLSVDVAYAINIDKIDYKYNNTISLAILF